MPATVAVESSVCLLVVAACCIVNGFNRILDCCVCYRGEEVCGMCRGLLVTAYACALSTAGWWVVQIAFQLIAA
jgi:hypothetical protein